MFNQQQNVSCRESLDIVLDVTVLRNYSMVFCFPGESSNP